MTMTHTEHAILDPVAVKRDFPVLQRSFYGKPLVYLDSAATSQKPQCVLNTLVDFYANYNANVHRSLYVLAAEATERYEAARNRVASFFGASSGQLVFTRNTTEAINLVAHAWGDSNLHAGDLIVLTEMEHHSNLVPWQLLAQRTGAQLAFVPFDGNGQLDRNVWHQLLERRPKLTAFTHLSNVLATINPVVQMTQEAHDAGAVVLVDGAQAAPHLPVDTREIGADFYAFSGHKMLGPCGIGGLIGREEILESMEPFLGGGSMIQRVRHEHSTWADPPQRFEAGTPNTADAVALGAAVDYLEQFGMEAVAAHDRQLMKRCLEMLQDQPDIEIYGSQRAEDRCGLVAFNFKHVHPHDVSQILDREAIAVRAGHHCCQLIMRVLDQPATVRASFYLYNTEEDIDRLAAGLDAVRRVFGSNG